jgi:hypothetical protein
MPRYPFSEWMAEQLRLTVFTVPGEVNVNPDMWWETAVGVAPNESTANLKMGMKTLAGTFHAGKLILKLEPGRIDWLLFPPDIDPAAGLPGEFPTIGPLGENLEQFSDAVERWLGRADLPEFARMAFGAVVNHPEQERRSAYVRLPDYLPIRIDPESSDFNLQINVPTDSGSGIGGLRVNRLSRWSIMALARVALRLDGAAVAATSSQFMAHALRVEVDINTSPEFREVLPQQRRIDLYRELVAFGRDTITLGLHP